MPVTGVDTPEPKRTHKSHTHKLLSSAFSSSITTRMLQWCYALVQRNCPHVVQTYKALEKRVVAMKRQKYQSAAPVSSSLNAITNRLIPSEVSAPCSSSFPSPTLCGANDQSIDRSAVSTAP